MCNFSVNALFLLLFLFAQKPVFAIEDKDPKQALPVPQEKSSPANLFSFPLEIEEKDNPPLDLNQISQQVVKITTPEPI